MEFKGTKGEWWIENKTPNTIVINSSNAFGEVARVFSENRITREQMQANAKVIKSAPELLRLCDMVYKSFGGGNIITFRESDIEDFKTVLEKALQP